jgi:hypothetical protein
MSSTGGKSGGRRLDPLAHPMEGLVRPNVKALSHANVSRSILIPISYIGLENKETASLIKSNQSYKSSPTQLPVPVTTPFLGILNNSEDIRPRSTMITCGSMYLQSRN